MLLPVSGVAIIIRAQSNVYFTFQNDNGGGPLQDLSVEVRHKNGISTFV